MVLCGDNPRALMTALPTSNFCMVPSSLREVLRELREGVTSGHLEQDKTLRKSICFYWPEH